MMENKQTAIQQMIDFINDINDNDRSEFNYYYDSIIAKLNELLEVEKQQISAAPELRYKDGTPMRKYNSPKLQEIENELSTQKEISYEEVKKVFQGTSRQPITFEPIEISDDEIKKAWEDFRIENPNTVGGFKDQYKSFLYGIKWYREQIKSKQ